MHVRTIIESDTECLIEKSLQLDGLFQGFEPSLFNLFNGRLFILAYKKITGKEVIDRKKCNTEVINSIINLLLNEKATIYD